MSGIEQKDIPDYQEKLERLYSEAAGTADKSIQDYVEEIFEIRLDKLHSDVWADIDEKVLTCGFCGWNWWAEDCSVEDEVMCSDCEKQQEDEELELGEIEELELE